MDKTKLPLLELFNSLQKAGFPLGINDYQLLVESLARAEDLGIEDRQALKRFCQALWVKSPQDKWRFEAYFEQMMPEQGAIKKNKAERGEILPQRHKKYLAVILGGILLLAIGGGILANWQSDRNKQISISKGQPNEAIKPSPQNGVEPTTPKDSPENNPTSSSPARQIDLKEELRREIILIVSFLVLGIVVGAGVRWLILQRQKKRRNLMALSQKSQIIATLPNQLTTDYFPFTPRQMKQTWRCWRCLMPSGISRELDIEATIRLISRQGFLLKPVLLPRLVNRTQLLLLMDCEGSMIPFQGLCRQLAKTALEGGGLQQTMVYYFHNCPQGYLYKEASCCQGIESETVLKQLQPKSGGVLIVSDGGAIRGNYHQKRVKATEKFLSQVRQYVSKISWLNPLPPKRWQQTTAMEIAQQVPMFELNRQGLEKAVSVLRGREK